MATSRDLGISSQVTLQEIEAAIDVAGLRPLPPAALEQLLSYLHLLLRWNSQLNLTADRRPTDVIRRHLVECVQCAQELPSLETLLDFGSGAGLPGIPIAIVRPEIRVTLGESQGKKTAFLREAVRTLSLTAEVFDKRIETMPQGRTFEAVTLRAVDRMAAACQAALPRVTTGGWLILFATSNTEPSFQQLPNITWVRRIQMASLEDGLLLMGQK